MTRKDFNECQGLISIDYIIGISIFILSFFFLFNILTSMFIPFDSTTDEVKAMSNRISTILVESPSGIITDAQDPNVIDTVKVSVLNESLNDPSKLDDILTQFGLYTEETQYKLNVSLNYLNGTLYTSGSRPVLLGGPLPDDYNNVALTSRIVYLSSNSKMLMLNVKVWL